MKRQQLIICLALLAAVLLLVGCGGNDDQPAAESGTTAYPGATAVPISETQPQLPEGQNTGQVVAPTAVVPTVVPENPTPIPAPTVGPTGGQPEAAPAGVTTQHTVQEREWLHQIARCYGASASEIVTANSLPHPGWIMAGEVWNIPNVGSLSAPIGPPCLIRYTVKSGDTLFSISRAYSVPIEELVFANYGCYGYNAHYDYVPGGPNFYGYGYLGGCYYTTYPMIYIGDVLVIPVNAQNAGMR
jgi:LysM repeat protein